MSNDWDVWGQLVATPIAGDSGNAVDAYLGVPSGYAEHTTPHEVFTSGARVAFVETMESILSYQDFPTPAAAKEALGTVIRVRTSSGDITEANDYVFVRWDDGTPRQIHKSHLTLVGKRRKGHYKRVASLGDLSDFMRSNGDLVHQATKDIWSFKKDSDGYVIERLFDDSGEPLRGV